MYMFQCYPLKSSHPRLLPQSSKVCSLHLCIFCCLTYRVIVAIFLNYICVYIYIYICLELAPKKDVRLIKGDWNAKVGSQETPRVTGKFGLGIRNEAGQRLTEFCQENALVVTNTLFQQQEKTLYMDITRWSTPNSEWLYSLQPKMEKLYTVSKNKTRSWLWLRSWTPYCQIQT